MANRKTKTAYLCSACGDDFPKWNGQCPTCKEWGTLSEFKVSKKKNGRTVEPRESKSLNDILSTQPGKRIATGLKETDRVLGGGLLEGSLILLGGNPGVGKSTLALQWVAAQANQVKVLYVTGEESLKQLALRGRRLGIDDLLISTIAENCLESILHQIPDYEFLVIDSIQSLYCDNISSPPGSVAQVRESAEMLTRCGKKNDCAVLIIGHVTKEGVLAGPKILEHIVDTCLLYTSPSPRDRG